MANPQRPLSPHLQVYRWQITMVMSIANRATGIVLTAGAFALVWWLLAAAGLAPYEPLAAVSGSILGLVVLFGFTACLVYHLLNGIRHLVWDGGFFMDIPGVYATGWLVWGLTVVCTLGLWVAIWMTGALA
ncbi:succinate dehydrogenase, cytochrome b556 subunit [Coralloluteibacterium stylophorae]|uniref:Succinate dehydrogenase cytochrome b556 subunit n=1 Tax=Coralloluteibacterium stylophorae TaxID=1776034 RepID=A0A8J7VR86_9GAMM|nr:succinate dehydrogenase, cytochrome b556 subunit [Coralloluteibacterium stylophorae]MBS7455827.1 succinate dehydrogenase, cytochrome b556 subunit [Coralloluteibacterium stylophorae]